MLEKGTEQYKKAQNLANRIQRVSGYERWNNNSMYNLFVGEFYRFINDIKKLDVFASQIAETIDKGYKVNGFKIANVSSKQAWILACAAIENNINTENF